MERIVLRASNRDAAADRQNHLCARIRTEGRFKYLFRRKERHSVR